MRVSEGSFSHNNFQRAHTMLCAEPVLAARNIYSEVVEGEL